MQAFSRQQLAVLALITVTWGINWPVMKLGVTHYPPLTFRALSMWLGLPVLGVFAGAAWLRESVHWQDWLSVGLMMVAIASVLWPATRR